MNKGLGKVLICAGFFVFQFGLFEFVGLLGRIFSEVHIGFWILFTGLILMGTGAFLQDGGIPPTEGGEKK